MSEDSFSSSVVRISINSDLPEKSNTDDTTSKLPFFYDPSFYDGESPFVDPTKSSKVSLIESFFMTKFMKEIDRFWINARYYIIPIEVLSFFFIFSMNFNILTTQKYLFQQIFSNDINDLNATYNVESNTSTNGCLSEETIINQTGLEVFIHGQKIVNNYNMGAALIYVLPSIVMTILVGPLSDYFGRKLFIFLVMITQLFTPIFGLIIIYYNLNFAFVYINCLVSSLSGGLGAILTLNFSYIADVTPKRWLTLRVGTLEASFYLAIAASAAVADTVIDQVAECDFRTPMWIIFSACIAGSLYCIILPESLNNGVKTGDAASDIGKGLGVLVRGFKLLFWKSYLSKNLLEIWLMIAVMVIGFFNVTGIAQIVLYFLHNRPLEWSYTIISVFQVTTSIAHLSVLVIVLPVLVIFKFSDITIGFIGSIIACGMCVFIALLTQTWEMFLAGSILGFEVIVSPGLKARIAHFINKNDIGAVFSIIAVLQMLSMLLASIIFNEVYSPEATHGNIKDRTSPRAVFWIAASAWSIAALILLIVFFVSKRNSVKKSKNFFVNANIFHHNKYGGISDS